MFGIRSGTLLQSYPVPKPNCLGSTTLACHAIKSTDLNDFIFVKADVKAVVSLQGGVLRGAKLMESSLEGIEPILLL
jgi:hypothetical protein